MKPSRLFNVTLLWVGVLFVPASIAQEFNRQGLPEGAQARLGKSRINKIAYSPDSKWLAVASSIGIWLHDANTSAEVALFTGHTKEVRSVVFSPDSRTLASGGDDYEIRLWDIETGQVKAILEGHKSIIPSMGFSPDGSTLASGSWDETIRLWDADTGQPKATLRGDSGFIESVAFSPDGKTLASGGSDYTIQFWDVESGQLKITFDGEVEWVYSVVFSPDGSTLAGGGWKEIRLWSVSDGYPDQLKATLEGHSGSIQSLAYSPDGTILASGGGDTTIRLWDVNTGQSNIVLREHTNDVLSVAFSPDGQTLASSGRDNVVRLWNPSTGQLKRTIGKHTSSGYKSHRPIAFSPDGRTIATTQRDDGTIWLWDTTSGYLQVNLERSSPRWILTTMAFSPEGNIIAYGDDSGIIRLRDVNTGGLLNLLEGHTDGISSVAFSPDGNILASGGIDGEIRLWAVDTGDMIISLREHIKDINPLLFSPDGETLASSSSGGMIKLWDPYSGDLKSTLFGGEGGVRARMMAFSPDSNLLACYCGKESALLWDVNSGDLKATVGRFQDFNSVTFSPDGETLTLIAKRIHVWDLNTVLNVKKIDQWNLKENPPLISHKSSILSGYTEDYFPPSSILAPDGVTVASTNRNTIWIWNVNHSQPLAILRGQSGEITSKVFSPDGSLLATGSNDGTVLLWDMSPYITPPTAIQSSPALPAQTALLANYPNPFNPETWIPYQLHAPARVRLSIYDVRGALVRHIDLGQRAAGLYLTRASAAHWDGRDQGGERVASGVYVYRLQAGPVAQVRKMVVVK